MFFLSYFKYLYSSWSYHYELEYFLPWGERQVQRWSPGSAPVKGLRTAMTEWSFLIGARQEMTVELYEVQTIQRDAVFRFVFSIENIAQMPSWIIFRIHWFLGKNFITISKALRQRYRYFGNKISPGLRLKIMLTSTTRRHDKTGFVRIMSFACNQNAHPSDTCPFKPFLQASFKRLYVDFFKIINSHFHSVGTWSCGTSVIQIGVGSDEAMALIRHHFWLH